MPGWGGEEPLSTDPALLSKLVKVSAPKGTGLLVYGSSPILNILPSLCNCRVWWELCRIVFLKLDIGSKLLNVHKILSCISKVLNAKRVQNAKREPEKKSSQVEQHQGPIIGALFSCNFQIPQLISHSVFWGINVWNWLLREVTPHLFFKKNFKIYYDNDLQRSTVCKNSSCYRIVNEYMTYLYPEVKF